MDPRRFGKTARTVAAAMAIVLVGNSCAASVTASISPPPGFVDAVLARGWEALQSAGIFASLFLLWAYVRECKRNDVSKQNLQNRIVVLEKERDAMLREVLGAMNGFANAVRESGMVTARAVKGIEDLSLWMRELLTRGPLPLLPPR